jgi:hypothetical protein
VPINADLNAIGLQDNVRCFESCFFSATIVFISVSHGSRNRGSGRIDAVTFCIAILLRMPSLSPRFAAVLSCQAA